MATPAAGMGLTASQQQIVDNAIKASANQQGGQQQTGAQQQAEFNAFLMNPSDQVAGATVFPSGLDFSTGATPNTGVYGGQTASTQMIESAVDPYLTTSASYAPGTPGLIAAVNNLFSTVAPPAPAAAPQVTSPVVATNATPSAPTGTSANPSTNPNPAVTGDVNTTTTTTATTGQNLASADPGSVLGQLLAAMQGSGGGTEYGQSGGTSIPASTILPTDTTGSSTTSSLSSTDIVVLGIIASLVGAAIWYFVIKHKTLGDLKHAI